MDSGAACAIRQSPGPAARGVRHYIAQLSAEAVAAFEEAIQRGIATVAGAKDFHGCKVHRGIESPPSAIDALRQRGADADIARLAAHVGIQLFITAYVHWLEAGAKADLAMMSGSVVSLPASIVPTNAQPPSSRQKSTRVPATQADPSPRRGRGLTIQAWPSKVS